MSLKQNELVEDFNFEDLLKAYYDCRRNKRRTKAALKFELNLEYNLLKLYHELKSGKYKIGKSICFVITYPKYREVWAANFRDRIVHHLIYNAISPRFYKRFIKDTYSCIPGRGTLAAAKKLDKYTRSITHNYKKKAYYLKADLSNFFVSIDKDVLFNLLKRYVKEKWLLDLLKKVVYNNPKNNVLIKSNPKLFDKLPKHKSLWHTSNTKGLPIGNLTSQFFSNVYLDVLDKYVKDVLHCKYYCRYVDDFVIMSYSAKFLYRCLKSISDYIYQSLKLQLSLKKCFINSVIKGIDFVGYELKPGRMLIRQRVLRHIFHVVYNWKKLNNWFAEDVLLSFRATMNSYLGMMRNSCSFNIRVKLCNLISCLFISNDLAFNKLLV